MLYALCSILYSAATSMVGDREVAADGGWLLSIGFNIIDTALHAALHYKLSIADSTRRRGRCCC
jgi:hypothetical protein